MGENDGVVIAIEQEQWGLVAIDVVYRLGDGVVFDRAEEDGLVGLVEGQEVVGAC